MSEKILYGELGAGEIVTVDVEGWDGESKKTDDATFTFTPRPKPLPEGTFSEISPEAVESVREVDLEDEDGTDDTPEDDQPDDLTPDVLAGGESGSDDDSDGGPAGGAAPQPQN